MKGQMNLADALRAHAARIEEAGSPTPLSTDLHRAAELIERLAASAGVRECGYEGPQKSSEPVDYSTLPPPARPGLGLYISRT